MEVEFYVTEAGQEVIAEFLQSLPPKDMAKVFRDIDLLAEYAPNLHEPYTKHIEGPIWELRSKFSSNKAKIFTECPEVKEEYDALGPQYEIIRAEIKSRKAAGMTQKELAERMGTAQANISRFESGNYNPTLAFLQKMARSLGKTLKITME